MKRLYLPFEAHLGVGKSYDFAPISCPEQPESLAIVHASHLYLLPSILPSSRHSSKKFLNIKPYRGFYIMFAFCIRLNNSVLVRGVSDPLFQDSVTEIGGSNASGGGVPGGDNVMDCGAGANDS